MSLPPTPGLNTRNTLLTNKINLNNIGEINIESDDLNIKYPEANAFNIISIGTSPKTFAITPSKCTVPTDLELNNLTGANIYFYDNIKFNRYDGIGGSETKFTIDTNGINLNNTTLTNTTIYNETTQVLNAENSLSLQYQTIPKILVDSNINMYADLQMNSNYIFNSNIYNSGSYNVNADTSIIFKNNAIPKMTIADTIIADTDLNMNTHILKTNDINIPTGTDTLLMESDNATGEMHLHVKSYNNCQLTLEADSANINENYNPNLYLIQDGHKVSGGLCISGTTGILPANQFNSYYNTTATGTKSNDLIIYNDSDTGTTDIDIASTRDIIVAPSRLSGTNTQYKFTNNSIETNKGNFNITLAGSSNDGKIYCNNKSVLTRETAFWQAAGVDDSISDMKVVSSDSTIFDTQYMFIKGRFEITGVEVLTNAVGTYVLYVIIYLNNVQKPFVSVSPFTSRTRKYVALDTPIVSDNAGGEAVDGDYIRIQVARVSGTGIPNVLVRLHYELLY